MASSVIFEKPVEFPDCRSLAQFRAWALSKDFPERGRIDYIAGFDRGRHVAGECASFTDRSRLKWSGN